MSELRSKNVRTFRKYRTFIRLRILLFTISVILTDFWQSKLFFQNKFRPPNPDFPSHQMFFVHRCWRLLNFGVGGGVLFFLLLNGVPKYIISIFGRFEFFQTNHIVLSENLRSKPINRFQPREILDTGIQIKQHGGGMSEPLTTPNHQPSHQPSFGFRLEQISCVTEVLQE